MSQDLHPPNPRRALDPMGAWLLEGVDWEVPSRLPDQALLPFLLGLLWIACPSPGLMSKETPSVTTNHQGLPYSSEDLASRKWLWPTKPRREPRRKSFQSREARRKLSLMGEANNTAHPGGGPGKPLEVSVFRYASACAVQRHFIPQALLCGNLAPEGR